VARRGKIISVGAAERLVCLAVCDDKSKWHVGVCMCDVSACSGIELASCAF
jgi:hypothetical protein